VTVALAEVRGARPNTSPYHPLIRMNEWIFLSASSLKNRRLYPSFWGELVVFYPISPITIDPQRELSPEPGLYPVRIFARDKFASHSSDFIRVICHPSHLGDLCHGAQPDVHQVFLDLCSHVGSSACPTSESARASTYSTGPCTGPSRAASSRAASS
jgi:hypothetical protein